MPQSHSSHLPLLALFCSCTLTPVGYWLLSGMKILFGGALGRSQNSTLNAMLHDAMNGVEAATMQLYSLQEPT